MKRKNTLIVLFVVIGALVVSAFSLVALNNNEKANLQRGREADAARYTAMAANYTTQDGATLQRGREADAARYTAMARSYTDATLGTNQQGLALYYQSERNSAPAPAFHYGPPGR